jgi:hypothetical protein
VAARQIPNGQKLQSIRPSQDNLSGPLGSISTFTVTIPSAAAEIRSIFDAMLANLTLEEGEHSLSPIVDSIQLGPKMSPEIA